ncbi:hypothetical protein H0H87_012951 [Tephrocybe sp. NHM501043]|nr:hypothetical protein H0H87_012951 [Tephrocybe sp. NHM501043]
MKKITKGFEKVGQKLLPPKAQPSSAASSETAQDTSASPAGTRASTPLACDSSFANIATGAAVTAAIGADANPSISQVHTLLAPA